MKTYNIEIKLLSPAFVGSGEGYGTVIDSDIVFDEVGLPYIPAKRIKGCLLDAAREVKSMFASSRIPYDMPITRVFGEIGAVRSAPVYFSDLVIENYTENKQWLAYLLNEKEYGDVLSQNGILETFTTIRQQTRIGDGGVALDGSLRSSRVIRKGLVFVGEVTFEDNDSKLSEILALACMNFRHFGTTRNRGFGEIYCALVDGDKEVSFQSELEVLCTG